MPGPPPGSKPQWIAHEQRYAYEHREETRPPQWESALDEHVLVTLLKRIKALEERVTALEASHEHE